MEINENAYPTLPLRLVPPLPDMLGQETDSADDTVITDHNIKPTVNFDINRDRSASKSILKRPNEISLRSKQILQAKVDAQNSDIEHSSTSSPYARSLHNPQDFPHKQCNSTDRSEIIANFLSQGKENDFNQQRILHS